jgi:hypothetical protein
MFSISFFMNDNLNFFFFANAVELHADEQSHVCINWISKFSLIIFFFHEH